MHMAIFIYTCTCRFVREEPQDMVAVDLTVEDPREEMHVPVHQDLKDPEGTPVMQEHRALR